MADDKAPAALATFGAIAGSLGAFAFLTALAAGALGAGAQKNPAGIPTPPPMQGYDPGAWKRLATIVNTNLPDSVYSTFVDLAVVSMRARSFVGSKDTRCQSVLSGLIRDGSLQTKGGVIPETKRRELHRQMSDYGCTVAAQALSVLLRHRADVAEANALPQVATRARQIAGDLEQAAQRS